MTLNWNGQHLEPYRLPIQDLEDQSHLTNGLIKLHDNFPVIQTQVRYHFITYGYTNRF